MENTNPIKLQGFSEFPDLREAGRKLWDSKRNNADLFEAYKARELAKLAILVISEHNQHGCHPMTVKVIESMINDYTEHIIYAKTCLMETGTL